MIPKKLPADDEEKPTLNAMDSCVARIVPETSGSLSSLAPHRDSGSVVVEFISRAFAQAVGIKAGLCSDAPTTLEIRRVRISKIVHSTVLYGSLSERYIASSISPPRGDSEQLKDSTHSRPESESPFTKSNVSDKLRSEIAALARLERSASDAITKECRKNSDALASLFSAGLPEALIASIATAERQMNSLEPREDLPDRLSAFGRLVLSIAHQLFSESSGSRKAESADTDSVASQRSSVSSRTRHARNRPSSAGLRYRLRDAASRREVAGGDDRGADASALRQRRSMLLSLMSRASRRSNTGYLNELTHRGNGALARDLTLSQLAPTLGSLRGVPPFIFGPPNELMQEGSWGDPTAAAASADGHNSDEAEETDDAMFGDQDPTAGAVESGTDLRASFLDSILRCSGDSSPRGLSGSLKQGAATHSAFVRKLIASGILVDSDEWVKASVDAQGKKVQLTSLQRSSAILRNVMDEEGTPLLKLAISFGCSVSNLSFLIACGAPVGAEEIKKAAETNQPRALSLLLQHTSYSDGMIDLNQYTGEIAEVFARAKTRQEELHRKMRDAAGSFIVELLRKLLRLGLSSRRNQTPRIDMCSRAICEVLIGDVLLRALQRTEKNASDPSQSDQETDHDTSDRTGRFSLEHNSSEMSLAPQGLLGSLPRSVVGESLLSDSDHITTFLLLVEDYLCSREMSDTAAGLTFLSMLLAKFPQLRTWSEIDRFGITEFISYHDVLASNRIAEILSRQLTNRLDVSGSSARTREAPMLSSALKSMRDSGGGVVLCPKKHTAVLHITRHSSFRCDLCGNGVDRGRPMHGCRECDWDACEECTDKAESGLVKCTAIRALSSDCLRFLSDHVSTDEMNKLQFGGVAENLSQDDNTSELNALSSKNPAQVNRQRTDAPSDAEASRFCVRVSPARVDRQRTHAPSDAEASRFCVQVRILHGLTGKGHTPQAMRRHRGFVFE